MRNNRTDDRQSPPIASSSGSTREAGSQPLVRGKVLNHAALTDVGNVARPGDNQTITHERTERPK